MATSSIFTNIKINNSKQAEALIKALEASEKEETTKTSKMICKRITDENEITAIIEKRNK